MDTGLSLLNIGLFRLNIGLSGLDTELSLFGMITDLYINTRRLQQAAPAKHKICLFVSLFCSNIGLFCMNTGLFWMSSHLFCVNTCKSE